MWGFLSDEEENPYTKREDDVVQEVEPPAAGTTGLALAEHYFGPLLSPVAASPALWTAYTEHRRGANAKYRNVFDRRKKSISDTVAKLECELGLDDGTLQKCISILGRFVEHNSEDDPRDADVLVRIYSPSAPKYIDVHFKYFCRCGAHEIQWSYSLGYKVYNHTSGSPIDHHDPPTNGTPSTWHTRGGWQSICWGYYDDEGNSGRKWRRIEMADMGLHEQGVLDVHEVLFGPIETPSSDDADAVLVHRHRKKLVATVRLLLAAVGIDYQVACTNDEWDDRPRDFMLEGLVDKWVARGIRAACGFQLSGDAEAARRGGRGQRRDQVVVVDDEDSEDSEDAEDGFSTDEW